MTSTPPPAGSPTTAAAPSSKAKEAMEDPWLDLEMEVDVAMRALTNAREQYRQALEKCGAAPDGKPTKPALGSSGAGAAKDWSHVSASAAQQVDSLLSALAQHITGVEPDVEVMQQSIQAAMEHPEKYAVATVELQRRQDVVQSLLRRLGKAKSDVAHGMKLRERRIQAMQAARAAREGSNGPGTAGGEMSGYMQQEYDAQRDIRVEQDAALDRIHAGVQSAEHKARVINKEMTDQNRELENLDHDMGAVQIKIDSSMQRIGALLDKTSDNGKIGIIVCLMVILAIMIIFLFTGDSASASAE